MADDYGKIGFNRLVKFAAKREPAAVRYLTATSVKDCRLTAGATPKVRVKTDIAITGGSGTGAKSNGKQFGHGKHGNRKRNAELRARRIEAKKIYR
jgi:hypothetical protein